MDTLRIDKWLWAARFYKTRSLATEAVQRGQVTLGKQAIKPSRDVRVGDVLTIWQGHIAHTVVVQAISRQTAHYATHIGQLVFLAKHLKANGWQTLSVPRGQSEQFNQQHLERLQAKADQQQPLSRY